MTTATAVKANLQLIYVTDIERSTTFYKQLFKAEPTFVSPRYVAFSSGENTSFAIWTGEATNPPEFNAPRYSEIGILVDSKEAVDTLFEAWKKEFDLNIVEEPQDVIYGRTFMIKDPDGHLIRVSPRDI